MSETELRTELERASAYLRPRMDAQTVWERGIRARRRNRALAVGGAVAAAAMIAIGGVTVPATDSTAPPPATNPTPDNPEVSQGWIPAPSRDQVDPTFGYAELASAPWDGASSVRSWDPVDPTPLADTPVEHAGLAVTSDENEPDAVYILGDDGQWRSLDMDNLDLVRAPGASQVPASVALAPDGTRLAVGQAGGAIVVDLTTGDRTTYDVPGLGANSLGRDVMWSLDSETLYVGSLTRSPAHAVDLATGEIATVDFPPARSTFLTDGRAVATLATGSRFVVGVYDKAGRLTARLRTHPFSQLSDAAGRGDRVALQRYGNHPATGGLVLDSNFKPVRFLPVTAADELETGVIGWRGDDTVLFVAHRRDSSAQNGWTSHVLAWNVDSGRVTRVADFTTFETYSVAADHLP